jgi:prefoldin subunit 5
MKQKLVDKIEELSKEAQLVMARQEQLRHELNSLDVRLHQIAGAMGEIDKFIKGLEEV